MPIDPKAVRFNGEEELQELCEIIRVRLHQANRIAMGESRFTAEIAEVFGRLGAVMAEADDELRHAFGDGYQPGTLTKAEQREKLIELLFPARPRFKRADRLAE